MTIDDATLAAVHQLWDTMGELPASQPQRGLTTLLESVGDLIASRHGYWLCGLRLSDSLDDAQMGWRARSIFFFGELPADQKTYRQTIKQLDDTPTPPDESTYRHVRQAGRFRAVRLRDHCSEAFFEGEHYLQHYLARGITDRLFVILPINQDLESYFVFDRLSGEPDFTLDDLEIASYALRSLGWFNRQVQLHYGHLIAEEALTPTERRVLNQLLGGNPEKNIADMLKQSTHTTHQHIKTLFRKFNVRSRAELTALWLGHG